MDKELLLHEAMATILCRAGSYVEVFDNDLVSAALEDFLSANASEENKQLVGNLLKQAQVTVTDLRARGFRDAAKYIKMADEFIHRQYQTMRHLQKSIDAVDFKSRLIKRMDLELADLENKALAIDAQSP